MASVTVSAIKADVGGYEPVAVTSTSRLSLIAGRHVGKDDPITVVRCPSGLPAVGEALEMADYIRRMGPFEPGRLPAEAMEYATLPRVADRLAERWSDIDEPVPASAHA